jgi:DNA-binding MarR family transcriptional regulator
MDADRVASTAAALRVSISLLSRRFRQVPPAGAPGLTLPQRSALARLERHGPTTSAALARIEQISPQSMGATLAGLEALGLVDRDRDSADGRRVVMTVNREGRRVLRDRRDARVRQLAHLLSEEFDDTELEVLAKAAPLLERLGQRL